MPDERPLSHHRAVDTQTIRRKTFPVHGNVVDVTWKGDDHHTGLADILSNHEAVRNLAKRIGNLTIRSHAREFQGWTLQVDRRFEPTSQDWAAIQRIADFILTSARVY